MSRFLDAQMDFIFFVYGLSFLILAGVCLAKNYRGGGRLRWLWLGLFALTHGFAEGLDLLALSVPGGPLFDVFRYAIMAASFACLVEFARGNWPQVGGRRLGLWIHLPLGLLAASGGLDSLDGAAATTRIALCFVGGIGSAAVLLRAARRDDAAHPAALRMAAAALGLIGVAAGLVTPPASFFPASAINTAAFREATGLPVQMIRATLAITAAAALWATWRRQIRCDLETPVSPPWQGRAAIVGTLLVLILAAGWSTTEFLGKVAHHDCDDDAIEDATDLADMIRREVVSADSLVVSMSGAPWAVGALPHGRPDDVLLADNLLDRYARATAPSICYLVAPDGRAVAATNRAEATSFVGQNCGFRPHVQAALAGRPGRAFALGTVNREPGYYASAPVRDAEGRVVGAAVIKKILRCPEQRLGGRELALLISPEGVVLLASRPEMVGAALWPIDAPADRARLAASRQFGGAAFQPILDRPYADGDTVILEGSSYILRRHMVTGDGWAMAVLEPAGTTAYYRLFGILVTLVLCLVMLGVLVVGQTAADGASRLAASERQAGAVTARARDFYLQLLEGFPAMIWRSDVAGDCDYFNRGWLEFTGRTKAEEVGDGWSKGVHSDDREACVKTYAEAFEARRPLDIEYRLRRHDGAYRWIRDLSRPYEDFDGRFAGYIGVCYDVTDQRQAEEALHQANQRLEELATTDVLTGLWNRRHLMDALDVEIRRTYRYREPLTLAILDLDHFKGINDTYGHVVGDRVLAGVARVMKAAVRETDVLARFGGEEFVILMPKTPIDEAVRVADRVRCAVAEAVFADGGHTIPVTASLGVTGMTGCAVATPESLLHAADQSLYAAKAAGRNCVRTASERVAWSFPPAG